jgi:branched-chain amino acid transport system substrate-binding protein
MTRKFLLVTALAIAAAVAALGAVAATSADSTGVTKTSITLGGTFPLSGPASSYAPIPVGMKAYFSYVNARRAQQDHKRGVYGRQIIWKYYDDAYNPANTVQLTRKLVEQDKVFALVGGLGTEPQLAVRDYLNQQKVPQAFVSTGATTWGLEFTQFPWTIGWQPDYQAEGALYGKYIVASQKTAKVAVIYQNDDYGRDYLTGLKAGLASQQTKIVATQGFEVTAPSVASQVAALKASGADTFMILATPAKTIQTYATAAKLGWKPEHIYVNSVSANDTFMTLAVKNAGPEIVNGSISAAYLKDPANPKWNNDAGMKLYRQIMKKYAPGANANDGNYFYGVAKAEQFVQALYQAGKSPTRESLMSALTHLNVKNDLFVLPGSAVRTTPNDHFPISQMQLERYNNGTWNTFGSLIDGRGK